MQAEQNIPLVELTELIDVLSTRLIIDGIQSIGPSDFEDLGTSAARLGSTEIQQTSRAIAASLSSAVSAAVPERTRIASSGIEAIRRQLDEFRVTSSASLQTTKPAATDESQAYPNNAARHSLAADENLILEFVTESNEHIETIEAQLLILEKDNCNAESLNAIFRGFHTIKGLAGFLDFIEIQSLAHEVETLLGLARTGQITVTPSVIDLLLDSNDVVRHELVSISQRLEGHAPVPTLISRDLLNRIRTAAGDHGTSTEDSRSSTPRPLTADSEQREPQSNPALHSPNPAEAPASLKSGLGVPVPIERRASDTSSVRVDTTKLDQLMDTVGEMVIAQTLIHHSPALEATKDAMLQRNLTQLARTTAELQRIATAMRMVPIGTQFQKTARMVRDLAHRFGKQVVFESSGEEAELDKSIAEQLSDPLLHMVRNSIDHGIEPLEERIRLGKDPTARIRIAAFHQSGQIGISISDDGRGLDRQNILAKALQNGLIQPGAQPPSDNDVYSLIFEPGFSTAEKVTDTSGRGVGMDVVRKHVQKLRGRIEIQSEPGVGTTFLIKLPLTLAIIDGLVVMVGDQRYVAPIFSIREILRPTKNMLSTVHGQSEMALVRGKFLPIIRLHHSFGIKPQATTLTDGMLIVTETEGKAFCLFVDRLIGNQEVVIKSLGRRFKDVSGIAGCAILGDGRVGLILDVDGIYQGRS